MFFKKLLSLVSIFSLFFFNIVLAYNDSTFVWNNSSEAIKTNTNVSTS